MDESKCDILKSKSVELLNIFYFQSDHKYKFRPESFNDLYVLKEKLNVLYPKTCKFFKRIGKFKSSKLKKYIKKNSDLKESSKNSKKVQDEQNVNDALQEATVLDKIAILKQNGMWSREALPKLMEPFRIKSHWDYLLEEVQWLSVDMKNRLHWKILAARTVIY